MIPPHKSDKILKPTKNATNNMKHSYLGLDWGSATIGTALAVTPLAQPLDQLPQNNQLLHQLQQLIHDYEITDIVIGNINPELASSWYTIQSQLPSHISIHQIDESFSTQEAWNKARDRNLTWQQFKPKEHSWAAAIILQRHLDTLV